MSKKSVSEEFTKWRGGGGAVMLKLSAMCGEEEGVSEVFVKVKGGRRSA